MRTTIPWVIRWVRPEELPESTRAELAIPYPLSVIADEEGHVPESLPRNVSGDVTPEPARGARLGDRIVYTCG